MPNYTKDPKRTMILTTTHIENMVQEDLTARGMPTCPGPLPKTNPNTESMNLLLAEQGLHRDPMKSFGLQQIPALRGAPADGEHVGLQIDDWPGRVCNPKNGLDQNQINEDP